jgi:multidrug efflux pump
VFSRFFIDRPIFAAVLSVVIFLAGLLALRVLPLSQYPPITPPTVQVQCNYPGASAQVVAETIAAPIEQEVNGVEGMMYMSSQSTNDGSYNLTVTFNHGVDLNMAQVLVQNRVNLALPMLPDVIRQTGVTTRKRSPDILMVINLISPDGRYDQLYLSNYALMQVRDEMARLPGVSDCTLFGQRDYSMRIWVDPDKLAARDLTAGDVANALREQNAPVALGQLGQRPASPGQEHQIPLSTLGRLKTPEQFGNVVLRTTPGGRKIFIKDVAQVEMAAKNIDVNSRVSYRSGDVRKALPTVSLAIWQLPDANAFKTADIVKDKIAELARDFPEGLEYVIRYDTTPYIRESIYQVFKTLRDAIILVAVVVLLFLQNWRSALIPLVAVPVAIVGTFAVMLAFGFSLNNLTLFGLVLAIGIVVDDAIVVVEAVEHHIEHGMSPRDATIKAMDQVSGPVIAVGLVLSAVFIPCAFISGITGQFFRQFALTIAVSTIISTCNSLTLSPALAALLLKPRKKGTYDPLPRWAFALLGGWLGWEYLAPVANPWIAGLEGKLGGVTGWSWSAGQAGPWLVAAACAAAGWLAGKPLNWVLGGMFRAFNAGFELATAGYVRSVGLALRLGAVVLVVYAGLLGLTYCGFTGFPKEIIPARWQGKKLGSFDLATGLPRGFIPSQDMGYFLVSVQLPDAASDERTRKAMDQAVLVAEGTPGVRAVLAISGMSFVLGSYASNFGSMFIMLDDFDEREHPDRYNREIIAQFRKAHSYADGEELSEADREMLAPRLLKASDLTGDGVLAALRKRFGDLVPDAAFAVFPPPPVRGVGTAGGFKIMIEDRGGELDAEALERMQASIEDLTDLGNGMPARNRKEPADPRSRDITGLYGLFRANVPQLYVDVDRRQCVSVQVPVRDAFDTLQIYLGSLYVNDFNRFGRTWQVLVQADPRFRTRAEDVRKLKVRNASGGMVPIGAICTVREKPGPLLLTRYNMYPAAFINGGAAPGVSSGDGIKIMGGIADGYLRGNMAYEWTEMAYLELQAGNTAMVLFAFSVVMVFLVLAAQYESWSLPLAIILVVPMCMLSALVGVAAANMDVNIFTQVGFVVLVGLASKNAILIVEFAKKQREAGVPRRQATLEAVKLRLRPIIMTSFAFILGVVPLMLAHGAGAEMRRTLGTAVFSGMLGVTLFGIFLTPVFFWVIDACGEARLFHSRAIERASTIALLVVTAGVPLVISYARRVTKRRGDKETRRQGDKEKVATAIQTAPAEQGNGKLNGEPVNGQNGQDGQAPAKQETGIRIDRSP